MERASDLDLAPLGRLLTSFHSILRTRHSCWITGWLLYNEFKPTAVSAMASGSTRPWPDHRQSASSSSFATCRSASLALHEPIQVTGLRTLSWVFTLVLLSRVRIERRAGNPVARRRRTAFSLFRSVQIRRKRFDGRLGFALSGFVGLLVYDGLRSLDSAL